MANTPYRIVGTRPEQRMVDFEIDTPIGVRALTFVIPEWITVLREPTAEDVTVGIQDMADEAMENILLALNPPPPEEPPAEEPPAEGEGEGDGDEGEG